MARRRVDDAKSAFQFVVEAILSLLANELTEIAEDAFGERVKIAKTTFPIDGGTSNGTAMTQT